MRVLVVEFPMVHSKDIETLITFAEEVEAVEWVGILLVELPSVLSQEPMNGRERNVFLYVFHEFMWMC